MKVRISLLPEQYKPKKQLRWEVMAASFLIVGFLAVIVYLEFDLRWKIKQKKDEIQAIEANLTIFSEQLKQTRELKAQLAKIEENLSVKKQIIAGTIDPTAVLNNIKDILPVDVWITDFSIDKKGEVNISLSTYSLNSVANTLTMFNQSPFFDKNTTMVSTIEQKDDTTDESLITFKLFTKLLRRRGDPVAENVE